MPLPGPWPADPVEGQPGHFEHTLWVKNSLIYLEAQKIAKPGTNVPAGKLLATTGTDTWDAVDPTSVGGVPRGVIVMWNGTTAPTGWALCDGQNGTPDLQDKFILGWTKTTVAPGSTGGAKTVRLTSAQSGLPAHGHTTDSQNAPHGHETSYTDLTHTHAIDWDGSHAHGGKWLPWVNDLVFQAGSGASKTATRGGNGHDAIPFDGSHIHKIHDAGLNHKHSVLSGDATHAHGVVANTAVDAAQPHDNMPPYYVLAYIMKL